MKDPESGEILGYEAQYVGRAELLRGETTAETRTPDGVTTDVVPATIELSRAKEEIRFGDRLLPAPERGYASYTPQAPQFAVDARVVSIYGSAAVANAAQNQVVAINRGTRDGMERGHVVAVLRDGERRTDTTYAKPEAIQLPDERHGLMFVFRVFDRVSYALVLQVQQPVVAGDHFTQP